MNISPIAFAKQMVDKTVDSLFYREAEYFAKNSARIEQVISWLCDEDSRKQYSREVSRLMVRSVFGEILSPEICGNMTQRDWLMYEAESQNSKYPRIKSVTANGVVVKTSTPTFVIEEYRYKDIFYPVPQDICIDAGAFCGETAIWFSMYGATKVYAFEPSPAHLPYIKENIEASVYSGQVEIVDYGLSNRKGTVFFSEEAGASKISSQGQLEIKLTTLDDFCREQKISPTLLKFDIEGEELAALEGGKEYIKEHKPKIAICLYHKKEDMLDIPFYLKQLVPEYKFYCKANHPYWEFVLYAMV